MHGHKRQVREYLLHIAVVLYLYRTSDENRERETVGEGPEGELNRATAGAYIGRRERDDISVIAYEPGEDR